MQIGEESAHLKIRLEIGNPHNAILRLTDVAAYIGLTNSAIYQFRSGAQMTSDRQQQFSRFFWGWDSGNLVKAQTPAGWRIVNRHASGAGLAQMACPTGPQAARKAFDLRIDLTDGSPRLRGSR